MQASLIALVFLLDLEPIAARAEATLRVVEDTAESPPSKCDSVSDNLVANCGFETGNYPPWLPDQGICFCSIDEGSRFTGLYGLQWGPFPLYRLAQWIPTVPGQKYTLTFLLRNVADGDAARPDAELQRAMSGSNEFRVEWEGNLVYQLVDAPPSPWMAIQLEDLLASQSPSLLRFGFYEPQDWWFFDDVVLVPSRP